MKRTIAGITCVFLLGLCWGDVLAQAADPAREISDAFAAAKAVMKEGPTDVKLNDQASFHVPNGFVFVPAAESGRILRAMGNRPSPDTLGMIFPADGENWFAVARYISSGYIKDDDAKDWNADEMLEQIKKGTEEANAERRTRGIPEMNVAGWVERPTYDAASHRLVWSIESRDKAPTRDSQAGVNYNTFLLGREGYVSLNFVTDLAAIEAQKPVARQLLAAVEFEKGKAYTDFNASTDRIAEYGLAALIGGVAAKKLGLFALIAAFAVKFAKVLIFGAIALGAGFVKFFRKKDPPEA